MKKVMLASALVALGVIGGVVAPMVLKDSPVSAQDKTGLKERVMDAAAIRDRITVLKKVIKEDDESLEQLELKAELRTLEAALAKDGDDAKIYVYEGGESSNRTRTLQFDAKGIESGLALRALPESFEIVETRDGGKLMLLDSRTGDTWVHAVEEYRGAYWQPLPRSAERYHIVPRNYEAEAGFKENSVEHRHRREQIMEMMEELNRELEEMKGYEKR